MLHLRIVSPHHHTGDVLGVVRDDAATSNVILLRDAALDPSGDVVLCDVAREGVNDVLGRLRSLGVHHDGSIAVEHVDASLSDVAAEAERRAPGYGSDAAVWAEVDERVREESTLSAGYLAFIVIAALIAAVGIVEDSPILIVGAMVVGPEFGPIAGLSLAIFKLRWPRALSSLGSLAVGFGGATLAAFVATAAADAADLIPEGFSPHTQPLTGFIVDPSALSFLVAFLAGVAGTLSLTQAKAGALIGVLISVTTIPAVGAVGVSAALGFWGDAGGAAVHLGLNVGALVLAGVITLWLQLVVWKRVVRRPDSRTSPPAGR